MKFKDNYVVVGDHLMDEEAYHAANPLEVAGDVVEVAGEDLRVYSARSYGFPSARRSFLSACV